MPAEGQSEVQTNVSEPEVNSSGSTITTEESSSAEQQGTDTSSSILDTLGESQREYFTTSKDGAVEFNPPSDPADYRAFIKDLPYEVSKAIEDGTLSEKVLSEPGGDLDSGISDSDESSDSSDTDGNDAAQVVAWEGFDSFGIPEAEFNKLSPETQESFDKFFEENKAYAAYMDPKFHEAFNNFMADPVIAQRVALKQGEQIPEYDIATEDFSKNKALSDVFKALGGVDSKQSQSLLKVFKEALHSSTSSLQNSIQQKSEIRQALTKELDAIVALDETLKSDLPYNDPKSPLSDFLTWYQENRKNIDLLGIGGPNTYSLYLQATGKIQNAIQGAVNRGSQNVTRKLRNISNEAKTLPKGKGHTKTEQSVNKFGIDESKFKSDFAYQKKIYNKYSSDPKMRALMESWAL